MEGEGSAAPAKGHYQSDLSSDIKKVFYDGELRFEAVSRSKVQGRVVSINVHITAHTLQCGLGSYSYIERTC